MRARWGILILAVACLLGGAVWVWQGAIEGEWGIEHCQSHFHGFFAGRESAAPDVRPSGWSWKPPGVRCEFTFPDGVTRTEVAPLI